MPKLDNETDLQYKQRIIDTKSASFCGAKYNKLSVLNASFHFNNLAWSDI